MSGNHCNFQAVVRYLHTGILRRWNREQACSKRIKSQCYISLFTQLESAPSDKVLSSLSNALCKKKSKVVAQMLKSTTVHHCSWMSVFYLAPTRHDSLCLCQWTVPLFYGWKERSSLFILVCRYHRGGLWSADIMHMQTLAFRNRKTSSAFDQVQGHSLTKCFRLTKALQ